MATPAANAPSSIFPTADSIGLKTSVEYGTDGLKSHFYKCNEGSVIPIYAPVKSKIYIGKNSVGEPTVTAKFLETIGIFKANEKISFSLINTGFSITNESEVNKGTMIGVSSSNTVRVIMNAGRTNSVSAGDVSVDGSTSPRPFVDFSLGNADENGNPIRTGVTGTNPDTNNDGVIQAGEGVDVGTIAKSAAFSTYFQLPGIFDYVESASLVGQRSLMNDQPLMPFIEQLCKACLRQFMSTPSGDFFAFYPDYFGGFGKAPYWIIEDIEILNGSIELSDDQLATHVYVVGDIVGPPSASEGGGAGQVNFLDRINTGGVINVYNAFMADFLNGKPADGKRIDPNKYPTLAEKDDAIEFLRKYGARPYYEDQPAVRAPIYETFLAYQTFCLKWSEQFQTQFEFTFMPELFPGGIVAFPDHGLQCYVKSVTHNCSYENGFTTTAELMAPAAYKGNDGSPVDPDKSWVHSGMIRQWPKDGAEGKFRDATDKDPAATEERDNN